MPSTSPCIIFAKSKMDDRKRKRKAATDASLRQRSRHCIDHNCVIDLKVGNNHPLPLVALYRCIDPRCHNSQVETTIYKCSLCGKAAWYPNFQYTHIKTKHPDRYSPPPLSNNDDNDTAFMDFSGNDYDNDDDDTSVSQPHLKKPKIEILYIHSMMTILEYLNSLHQSDVNYICTIRTWIYGFSIQEKDRSPKKQINY